jgi:hypothetical protein
MACRPLLTSAPVECVVASPDAPGLKLASPAMKAIRTTSSLLFMWAACLGCAMG